MSEADDNVIDSTSDLEPLMATAARLFACEGKATEVAILTYSKPAYEHGEYQLRGSYSIQYFDLYLYIPIAVYAQLGEERSHFEDSIRIKINELESPMGNEWSVHILPILSSDEGWREKAHIWLTGKGVTNQGRVRSDNIAPRSCDGLLFRSEPEIYLYKALKAEGVSFAPLPVFIRGGKEYRRIEPDFVIIKDGIVMIVEVDGDTVHQETPAEAHARTTILAHEGVHVERVRAKDCNTPQAAEACAREILRTIRKLKISK